MGCPLWRSVFLFERLCRVLLVNLCSSYDVGENEGEAPFSDVLLYQEVIVMIVTSWRKWRAVWCFVMLGVALGISPGQADLRVDLLNVGEGNAALVRFRNEPPLLIDVGNPRSYHPLRAHLLRHRVEKIHAVIITHPHMDHMGSLIPLLSHYEVPRIFDNGQSVAASDNDFYRWYAEEIRARPEYRVLERGDVVPYGDGEVRVLHPNRLVSDWNTNSLVLLLQYRGFRMLFMGDANFASEQVMLSAPHVAQELRADVLLVGHHGAADASSTDFLKKVQANFSVVSIDSDNVRGYPDQETVQRLRATSRTLLFAYDHHYIRIWVGADGRYEVIPVGKESSP
ncbi:MBL fold metallo-hydrolase [bacterium]|nr:MBL fold metallo-hydrolase [bacterium]